MWYSSIKFSRINAWATEMLPQITIFLPGNDFNFLTFSTASPLIIAAGFHFPQGASFKEFEKTTLSISFSLSAIISVSEEALGPGDLK